MDDLTGPADRIELTVPLDHHSARIMRVVAATLGADAGYSIDEIDDFRLALDEAFGLLVDADAAANTDTAPARALCTFAPLGATLQATLRRLDDVPPATPDALATGILQVVVDEFRVADTVIVLRKRATELTIS